MLSTWHGYNCLLHSFDNYLLYYLRESSNFEYHFCFLHFWNRMLIIILLKSVDFFRYPLHRGTPLIISSCQKYSYSILNFYHSAHQIQFQNLRSSSAIEYFVNYQLKNLILWIYWLNPNLSICQNPAFNLSLLIHF